MGASTVFYLGLWNPAGATRKKFKTREEREAFKSTAARTGYIAWEENDVNPR